MYIEAFITYFSAIIDQRQSAKVTYPLCDVLFVTTIGSSNRVFLSMAFRSMT
ncbi:MAG: hypothetical protein ACJASB_003086, partial [Shewanella psychromarinicola]